MSWEGKCADTSCTNTARGEFVAAVAECGHSLGQPRSSRDGEIRLTARIVQATEIPQGLVLWPDVPCVRVTATINDQDVSCKEDVLNTPKLGSTTTSSERDEPEEERNSEASNGGQTQPGELVLDLHFPKMQGVINAEEHNGAFPTLSLRVEVLVGRVVTATGSVDLSDELKASLSGSSTKRAVLSLTGGGEMVCIVDLKREAGLSASTPQGWHTVPNVGKADGPQANDEALEGGSDGTGLEHFLDSVACWGLLGPPDGAASIVNSKSSPVTYSTAQTSSAGPGRTDEGSSGGIDEEMPLGSGDHDGSSYPELVEWLGRTHPDPPFLRLALEKSNSYAFPLVEAPFLAALLKHGGLVGEAFQAVEMMKGEWVESRKMSVGHFLER